MRRSLLTLFAALALAGCNETKQAAAPPAAPPRVGFVTVTSQSVKIVADVSGRVLPSLIAEVRPQVGGIIEKRLFVEGAEVKEGEVLYQIATATYQTALDSARAALDRARATQTAAKSKLERYQTLSNRQVVSTQDLETAAAAADQATADVAAADAAVNTARINLDYTKVRAPISGRIGISSLTEGALVTAGQATALATIQALDPVFIDVPLPSAAVLRAREDLQAGKIKANPGGVRLTVLLEDGTRSPETGELKLADVTVSQTTGTITLRATIANPVRALLPGMFVRGAVDVGEQANAVLLTQRAVARDPRGRATVMIVGPGDKAEARVIETVRAVGADWIVDKGLAAGDRVIVDGLQRVRAGAPVTPEPAEPQVAADSAPKKP